MTCAVILFTRDLRVRDQPALAAAAREAERVVPLFVLDDVLLGGSCGSVNRLSFLLDSLHDLDGSLRERGARLVLRRGDPVEEALRVTQEAGASSIHLSAVIGGSRWSASEPACA
jgi:deoxyribodipyrimidine photo-lyase